jgi:LysR family glycine cleavage system transcriptional activator
VRKIAAFRDWVLAQAAADPLIAHYAAVAPLERPAASPLTRPAG